MKLKLVFIAQLIGIAINAQTIQDREKIRKELDDRKLTHLKNNFIKDYLRQQNLIKDYLIRNPDKQREVTLNKNFLMIHHIDNDGNPIYLSTKDAGQIANTKANYLYQGGGLGVSISGSNMVVGIWDGGQINVSHELLNGKGQMQNGQSLNSSVGNDHMQAVSGIIVGKYLSLSGNSNPQAVAAKGIAFNATSKNYDWDDDLSEMTSFAADGYLISNHSYGYPNDFSVPQWTFGAYDVMAKNWDQLLKATPYYLPFVSAGNEQQDNGNPDGDGFDIITGSAASKNVVTVGAINSDNSMSDYSNWGPTDDGRVKPDIVTLGTSINVPLYTGNNSYSGNISSSSGTSYSAPAAAAVALLLQQYYHSIFGHYMKASSLKALLLHTANDAGNAGPDAKFGWGVLNAERAANTIKEMQSGGTAKLVEFTTNPLNDNNDLLSVTGISGNGNVRASICWSDDEGVEQTSGDGVNNTSSRLVYKFGTILKLQSQNNTPNESFPYKPLSVEDPETIVSAGTDKWANDVDNYQQLNISGVLNADISLAVYKHTSSPSSIKPYSVLVTGLKNSMLSTLEENVKKKIVFYNSQDFTLKMITNNQKDSFGNYEIYDASGKLIKGGNEKSNVISVGNFVKGVYILVYGNKKETFRFRL